jgi:hypothetical protein
VTSVPPSLAEDLRQWTAVVGDHRPAGAGGGDRERAVAGVAGARGVRDARAARSRRVVREVVGSGERRLHVVGRRRAGTAPSDRAICHINLPLRGCVATRSTTVPVNRNPIECSQARSAPRLRCCLHVAPPVLPARAGARLRRRRNHDLARGVRRASRPRPRRRGDAGVHGRRARAAEAVDPRRRRPCRPAAVRGRRPRADPARAPAAALADGPRRARDPRGRERHDAAAEAGARRPALDRPARRRDRLSRVVAERALDRVDVAGAVLRARRRSAAAPARGRARGRLRRRGRLRPRRARLSPAERRPRRVSCRGDVHARRRRRARGARGAPPGAREPRAPAVAGDGAAARGGRRRAAGLRGRRGRRAGAAALGLALTAGLALVLRR